VITPPHEAHAGVPFALTGGHFGGQTQRGTRFA
jgi:hypothetical protein